MGFRLDGVTLSYPNLYQARRFNANGNQQSNSDNNQPVFSATLLIPHYQKGDKLHGQMVTLINAVTEVAKASKYGQNLEAMLGAGKFQLPFKRTNVPAENSRQDGTPVCDPEKFKFWIRCTAKNKPGTVDRMPGPDNKPLQLDRPLTNKLYAGCIVNASVNPSFYDYGKPGVSLFLNNIQHWADGPRLDNRIAAEDEFQADPEAGAVMQADAGDAANGGADPSGLPQAGAGPRGAALADLLGA